VSKNVNRIDSASGINTSCAQYNAATTTQIAASVMNLFGRGAVPFRGIQPAATNCAPQAPARETCTPGAMLSRPSPAPERPINSGTPRHCSVCNFLFIDADV
jgi:hypothetical protein